MDVICQELGIPRKQIKETKRPDRFIVLSHKTWLRCLIQDNCLTKFPVHPGPLDEWPNNESQIDEPDWSLTYFMTYKKFTHKVIPLPNIRKDTVDTDFVLNFAQLLQNISASNHRNLWKNAYGKYSGQRTKVPVKETINKNERNTVNLVPYDSVLLEAIERTYGCRVLHVKLDNINQMDEMRSDKKRTGVETHGRQHEPHPNLYPVSAVLETSSHFVIIFANFLENTLYDCITYSPSAIMDKTYMYNKPLFIIYQLWQLIKSFHDRGLLLGNIGLDDIFITENLWLQVMPQIDCNILQSSEKNINEATNDNKTQRKVSLVDDLSYSLKDYTEMWCNGQVTNFDYLTILNNLSGRRLGDPCFHHIMPWVSDFVSRNGMNWRDLSKSKYRLNKGDTHLDLMFAPSGAGNSVPHHVSDALSEITYMVYMARRTPKSILCKHVRNRWVPGEYPASIQRLYDWTPDECIPEFFSDPNVFKSIHEDLPDLEIPTWSTCPEDFIARHREALESQTVSERLHHWIDLNFGFKLSGNAAIKSKNVYLSIVDEHKTLCRRGIVQLFHHPHPPKQYQTIWTAKTPPRIYSQNEIRQRMTRSTEDLPNKYRNDPETSDSVGSGLNYHDSVSRSSSKNRTQPNNNMPESASSTSLHSSIQKSQNQIILPKDYNPIAALNAVENMEVFLQKTFYKNVKNFDCSTTSIASPASASTRIVSSAAPTTNDEGINAFTNKIFSDCFEENLMKDSKRLHNLNHKNLFVQSSTRNYKQIISNYRHRELQVIACIIVELFLANKIRPLGIGSMQKLNDRIEACKNVLKVDFALLPKCVQYPTKLLFSYGEGASQLSSFVTDAGLPKLSAQQMLQPFLSNFLFPFPYEYLNVYTLLTSLYQYSSANKLLDILTYFDCDSSLDCRKFDALAKQRTLFKRKIAECKVMACAAQIEKLFKPHGYEQFDVVDLILPHIIDLLRSESTAILAAWFLFDNAAIALGQNKTQKYLLDPILKLYDADGDERLTFLNSNIDSSMKFTSGTSFKNRKTIKLYHHSFLLRLIVRFGLSCFLNNFIPPLIEAIGAIGGCKEPIQQYQDNSIIVPETSTSKHSNYKNAFNEHRENSSRKANESDEMFTFENEGDDEFQKPNIPLTDSSDNDVDNLSRITDQFDNTSNDEQMLELRLNHSNAMEVTEETALSESGLRLSGLSGVSFEEDAEQKGSGSLLLSPTIPIPSSSKRNLLNTIDCEVGSKVSTEGADILEASMDPKLKIRDKQNTATNVSVCSSMKQNLNWSDQHTQYQITEMCSESIIWLSHRLGPVLTARHLTRNLLKMLTLCYIGQETLLPDYPPTDDGLKNLHDNLLSFSIADGRIVGDRSAVKVLECLTSITAIYGDHFILLQYFPHITELIALCKKRITPNLEGGLISSLQLLKYLVPCLSDSIIMEQLTDTILKGVIHPIIRFIASTRFLMPNGFLARNVMSRKLLDAIYVLAVRIGPEMTKNHLCIPALQRFFLIFDKAHGISDNISNDLDESRNSPPPIEDANFIEIRRDGGTKEWSIKGSPIQITTARSKEESTLDNITPPKQCSSEDATEASTLKNHREKALEEIKEVFTPHLAHISYLTFLKYLGDAAMKKFVKNLPLILTLCHDYEQPEYASLGYIHRKDSNDKTSNDEALTTDGVGLPSTSSFGTAMIGNRIEVFKENESINDICPMELLDLVSHKHDQINTTRHLRGNWLAYWEHEIGRAEKNHFNFKQIKLQTFAGHANAVRSLLCLDNENSFMSASKDKTVKLWSLRSEGDGSKISSCQFTYSNHRKSVHSLAFLESLRLAVSTDSGVHIWDPFVGGEIGLLDSHKLTPVSVVKTYSATSSALILAGTTESTIKIIDARILSYVNEWKFSLNQTSGSVRCITMAPSGHWIAVGLSSGQLIICDGRTGMIIASWKATDSELLQLVAVNDDQIISTSLDHSIIAWSALDGSLLYYIKSPNEPIHVLKNNQSELIFGTPANRVGVYANVSPDSVYSIAKLRTETFKGVLTSMAVLSLNRMLLVGGDSGNISLLC